MSLSDLKVISLASNPLLSDLTPLGQLTNLEEIYLSSSKKIENLEPLMNLTKLKILDVDGIYYQVDQLKKILRNNPNLKIEGTYREIKIDRP